MMYYTSSGKSNITGTRLHYKRRDTITLDMDIAILIPTTTRKMKSPKLEKLRLFGQNKSCYHCMLPLQFDLQLL
jgi:hypothetical protein